ncbi:hypothetical protein [Nocardia sp. NPDC051570]|uniref:hypothetical protein n=1 Tax=Nocardia sp. NPDC051570 TaxID=3364324 RepID=UPI00378F938D
MPTAILAAAVRTDPDTDSYVELAARAGRECLRRAGIDADAVGLLISSGVLGRGDAPAAVAIEQRLGLGPEFRPGRAPALSFDLRHGALGVLHAMTVADGFLIGGKVRYALLVAGDTPWPTVADPVAAPTASGAALLLENSTVTGGFGTLRTSDPTGPVPPSAWTSSDEAGIHGHLRPTGDAFDAAASAVERCLADDKLSPEDFRRGRAVLLSPSHTPDFVARLANTLGLTPRSVIGAPEPGRPYSAAPVHAYVHAERLGCLESARTVLFLGAYDRSAACLAYHRETTSSTVP